MLPPDAVHLWCVPHTLPVTPAVLALLDAGERQRQGAFHFQRDRDAYALSHALVRQTLSRYAAVAPAAWRFAANAHGKPAIVSPTDQTHWCFNLSHTPGLSACAVAHVDVGVDVEDVNRRMTPGLADRFFAPSEAAALRALPAVDQPERFFTYWTLKEAYIKAVGLGLSLPLDSFGFELTPGQPARLAFANGAAAGGHGDGDVDGWQFLIARPTPRHALALAMRSAVPLEVHVTLLDTL